MAQRKQPTKKDYQVLPSTLIITVCAQKDDKVVLRDMTISQANDLKKVPGWRYTNYQKEYCQMKSTE